MTNGTIAARVDGVEGSRLTVAYKGGQQVIVVDPKAPVVAFAPGARADLKPGAAIVARGRKSERRRDRRRPRDGRQGRTRPAALSRDPAADWSTVRGLPVPDVRDSARQVFRSRLRRMMSTDKDTSPVGFARRVLPLHLRLDQADPLRRSGLSDPVVPLGAAVQHARLHEQPGGRRARPARSSGRASTSPSRPTTRPTAAFFRAESSANSARRGGRALVGHRRRAVEPVSARPRSSPGGSAPRAFRSASAASTSPAASPCCPRRRRSSSRRRRSGIALFAGEAEERPPRRGACATPGAATLKPLYNFMDELPSLEGEPPPILPRKHVERTSGTYSSIDLGRGCPYQCSFCTIINVQGRKSRFRTPDDLEQIIRENKAQGIDRFFITDDNFARNSDWEILLDRVIELARTKASGSASPSRSTRSATRSRTSSRRRPRPAPSACSSASRTSTPTI